MKTIIYKSEGKVILTTYTDGNVQLDFDHIDVTGVQLPPEPIETWYIENGKIKIDLNKLADFYREQLAPLTRRQFKLILLEHDLIQKMEDKISLLEDPKFKARIQIEYLESDKFERTSEFILYMANTLELTTEQIDRMWLHAMSL